MKRIIWLVLFMLPGVSIADQWLCVAEDSNGFFYDESSKKWARSGFYINDHKYIVKPSTGRYKYTITKLGNKFSTFACDAGFNDHGMLDCETSADSLYGVYKFFKMNHLTGRFTLYYMAGYLQGDNNDDSPSVTIGKCSKF
jgi:hypothetical protein